MTKCLKSRYEPLVVEDDDPDEEDDKIVRCTFLRCTYV